MPNTYKHKQVYGISYNQVHVKPLSCLIMYVKLYHVCSLYHATNCNHFFGKPTIEIINQLGISMQVKP